MPSLRVAHLSETTTAVISPYSSFPKMRTTKHVGPVSLLGRRQRRCQCTLFSTTTSDRLQILQRRCQHVVLSKCNSSWDVEKTLRRRRERKNQLNSMFAFFPLKLDIVIRTWISLSTRNHGPNGFVGRDIWSHKALIDLFLRQRNVFSTSQLELHFDKTTCWHLRCKIWRRSDVVVLNKVH